MLGLDCETAIPHRVLQEAGVGIMLRYVTPVGPAWPKSMSLPEADDYRAGDILIGPIFETTSKRMLAGAIAGHGDAQIAMDGMDRCRIPDGTGLAFSADWDVQATQVSAVLDYLHAARDALGSRAVPICYGGRRIISAAHDAGFLTWQTVAWSQGPTGLVLWSPYAIARQTGEQRVVGGVQVDVNEIYAWPTGLNTGADMPKIPASVASTFPDVAGGFPANSDYDTDTAIIYADAGARAAAARAQTGLANDAKILSAIKSLADQLGQQPPVDAHALAVDVSTAVIAAMVANGGGDLATATRQIAEAVAAAIEPHLPAGGIDVDALAASIAGNLAGRLAS